MHFGTIVTVMANLEEIRQLQKLLTIERISFNEQLGHAVSISLATCSWFSLFFSLVRHFVSMGSMKDLLWL